MNPDGKKILEQQLLDLVAHIVTKELRDDASAPELQAATLASEQLISLWDLY